jgi:hypothetical protein
MNPDFKGFLTGLLQQKANAAVAKPGKLQHAPCFSEVGLGNS